jgi:hypothetical protein
VQGDPVRTFIEHKFGPSTYKRADVDLNGDGRKETLVYFTDASACGSGGCTLVVLSPEARGYRIVMRSTVTQPPISVLPTSTRGWRDIGVTVWGGGVTRTYQARLRFDGHHYPSNPTVAPAIKMSKPAGEVLIRP